MLIDSALLDAKPWNTGGYSKICYILIRYRVVHKSKMFCVVGLCPITGGQQWKVYPNFHRTNRISSENESYLTGTV